VGSTSERGTHTNELLVETRLGVLIQSKTTQSTFEIPRVLLKSRIRIEVKGTCRRKESLTLSIEWTLLCLLSLKLI